MGYSIVKENAHGELIDADRLGVDNPVEASKTPVGRQGGSSPGED
jgi:hypothetical protein